MNKILHKGENVRYHWPQLSIAVSSSQNRNVDISPSMASSLILVFAGYNERIHLPTISTTITKETFKYKLSTLVEIVLQ